MSNSTGTTREQPVVSSREYQILLQEHAHYDAQLAELAGRKHLTDQDQIEESRLKKLKLRTKDQMEQLAHHEMTG
ncbi:MAG: YdcH family protein [Candidatus Acidiferrales bacterium]